MSSWLLTLKGINDDWHITMLGNRGEVPPKIVSSF